MDVKEKVRVYLVDKYMPGKKHDDLALDESILESGLLDSAGIFDLVAFLESTFDVRIQDEDIVFENFESIATIGNLIESRLR